jgi:hypothetical protein
MADMETRMAVVETKHHAHELRIGSVEENYARIMTSLLEIQTKMPGLIEVRSWVVWGVLTIVSTVLLAMVAVVLHK